MNAGRMMLSFAIAGAAGAVLGVLFAPAKGADTRKRIAQTGASFAGESEGRISRYIEAAADGYDAFKDSATDWADMGGAEIFYATELKRVR